MKKRGFLYIVIAGILWGTSGIFFNLLKPYGFTPLQMTAMRGVVSGLAMVVFTLLTDRSLFRVKGKELVLFIGSGLAVFTTAASYYAAIEASSVSTAVILMYTAPVFVMAYSVAFLKEKLNTIKLVAVVLVMAGCALVSGIAGGMTFRFWGIVLGLGAGILYSIYNILTKISALRGSDSRSATLYIFLVMGISSICVCDPAGLVQITATAPLEILPLILGIGICTCVMPYFLYTMALQEIPAGTAASLGIIEPMAATIFSVVIFKEQLSIYAIVGIVMILGAVFMLSKGDE